MNPLISICIPAYKRVYYLKRLLDSISFQAFRDFEVVITDDSNDMSVSTLLEQYRESFPVRYQKNPVALGTPENWNEAIRLSKGEWIKLMHDDDWFTGKDALQQFANAASAEARFIFSGYNRVFLETGKEETVMLSNFRKKRLFREPHSLFALNVIGPPSVTMVHRSVAETYDKRLSWLVDIDYYIRVLKSGTFQYIPKPLVKIGMSAVQVTSYSHGNPEVELPEAFSLLDKFGTRPLDNIWVYDGWWRLMRNMNIRNEAELKKYVALKQVPRIIGDIITRQRLFPPWLLKTGLFSKLLMTVSFAFNRLNGVNKNGTPGGK